MLLLFANGIALSGVSWIFWRMFRQFIVGSPLDNIPGPPSKNWWTGMNKQTEFYVNDDLSYAKVLSPKYSMFKLGIFTKRLLRNVGDHYSL